MPAPIDLAGQRFGRLTAIKREPRNGPHGSSYWRWKCDCGREAVIESSAVKGGRTVSCGCHKRQVTRDRWAAVRAKARAARRG
jgi:hypothetical protein